MTGTFTLHPSIPAQPFPLMVSATARGIVLRGEVEGDGLAILITPEELDGLRGMLGQVMQLRRAEEAEKGTEPIILLDMRD